jgi:hypothetical protein
MEIDNRGAADVIAEIQEKRKENDESPKTKDKGQKIKSEDEGRLLSSAKTYLGDFNIR